MRSDIIKMYKEIHSWVGIISGMALFIAFYAGAITMFETPLQRWASPPSQFDISTPLNETQELLDKVLEQYPEAAQSYQIVLNPSPEQPARLNWSDQILGEDNHATPVVRYAGLAKDGSLQVSTEGPSQVGSLVDVLHQQVGLPFSHEISMPIMGAISLLYCIALVSGVIVLIPTLVKDLFAFRIGKNLKRLWLDLHNILGLFSLPFHIIMALTAVVFAFHDQFYGAQQILLEENESLQSELLDVPTIIEELNVSVGGETSLQQALTPEQIVSRVEEQAPGFNLTLLNYRTLNKDTLALRVLGEDPRYGMRSPAGGIAEIDPYSGDIVAKDYLPGHQNAWSATVSSFFTLHFGSFGGGTIRWSYFFLGLAGACLFYTGNLLWVETHRKKIRRANKEAKVVQTTSARILGALTVGVSLGCVAGISLTIAAAKFLPQWVEHIEAWHNAIYYAVFLAAIAWAFIRGAAKGAVELLLAAAVFTLMIPLASLISLTGFGWNHYDYSLMVDVVAIAGAAVLLFISWRTARRINRAPVDSIWYAGSADVKPGVMEQGNEVSA